MTLRFGPIGHFTGHNYAHALTELDAYCAGQLTLPRLAKRCEILENRSEENIEKLQYLTDTLFRVSFLLLAQLPIFC